MMSLVEAKMDKEPRKGQMPMSPRRKRYWKSYLISVIFGIAMVGAIIMGKLPKDTIRPTIDATVGNAPVALDPVWSIVVVILAVIGCLITGIIYHRNVDEQEERAVLWGGLIGWYATMMFGVSWDILWAGGVMARPDAVVVVMIGTIIGLAVMLWKKFL